MSLLKVEPRRVVDGVAEGQDGEPWPFADVGMAGARVHRWHVQVWLFRCDCHRAVQNDLKFESKNYQCWSFRINRNLYFKAELELL